MAITVSSMNKKEMFQYSITPYEDRPTSTAKSWPSADTPVTGKITAYMVDRYQYNGRPAVTSYVKLDNGKWYKSTSNHIAFLLTSANEAFGADLSTVFESVRLYKRPMERGDAAEMEMILAD